MNTEPVKKQIDKHGIADIPDIKKVSYTGKLSVKQHAKTVGWDYTLFISLSNYQAL